MAFFTCPSLAFLRVNDGTASKLQAFASMDALARAIAVVSSQFENDRWACDHRRRLLFDYVENRRVLRLSAMTENDTVWRVAQRIELEAFGVHGRTLNLEILVANGKRILEAERIARRYARWHKQPYCGVGPVPGVSNSRSRWRRRIHTRTELRLNALVLVDEGEVSARASRCGNNLPDTRDDHWRDPQRGWKSQNKGRKSWDRG